MLNRKDILATQDDGLITGTQRQFIDLGAVNLRLFDKRHSGKTPFILFVFLPVYFLIDCI